MSNNTTYLKSQAITTTVAGSSPAKTYTPTVGSISTDDTVTNGDNIWAYGSPLTNTLLVITDDLVTSYAD